MDMLSPWRKVLLVLASILYTGSGVLHFLKPDSYLKIMPPYMPAHLAMVYISGVAEIAGGLGLLFSRLRRPAAWGLVALLIAVLPANIHMATNNIQVTRKPVPTSLLWARLPLQALLVWWVLWCTQETE